ncbi:hypothetical protein KIS1582_3406 [Cytobacillus firmus]|uniref:Uncharacterized protein n=1 Tax=Cytobacillus firmus TaxID=1399 RepID=A0A800N9I2_CYTFI|nr:hypothetical protein KIS1582_3406 [Cytobacillus firmus]
MFILYYIFLKVNGEFFSSPMIFPFSPDIIIHLESHNFTDRKGKDIIA